MIQKVASVVRSQLTQGVSPQALALSCAVAVVFGTFPILGTTTFLCFLFGLLLNLNQPLTQVLNYLLYPLQILLIPIFLKSATVVFQLPEITLNPIQMVEQFKESPSVFLSQYGEVGLYGVLIWLVVAIPTGTVTFFVSRHIFQKLLARHP